MIQRSLCIALMLCVCATATFAQQKKNLTPDDYGKWQHMADFELSPNGEWVAYQVTVQEDNDTLFVVNQKNNKTYKLEFSGNFEFSKDNKWIAYRIGLPFKEAEKMRDQNKPIEYKMGVLNLETGKKEIVQNISRFGFSRNGRFLAVSLAPPKENKDKGSVLLIKNMTEGTTHTIGNVTEYAFNKKSDYLAYIIESANTAGNSVELLNLNTYNLKVVASDTCRFSKISWQKEGDGLAFFKTFKREGFEEENAMVYSYIDLYKTPSLKIFDPMTAAGFPHNMRIYNNSALRLSNDMSATFFGLKSWTAKPKKEERRMADTSKSKPDTASQALAKKNNKDEKLALVDIWHWKDPEIQPRQKVTYNQDKEASFLSAWIMDNNSFYQIATEEMPNAALTGNQQYAVVSTYKKYKPAFKEDYADFYLVNTKTGERKLLYEKMLEGFFTSPQSSPDGKYLFFFKDKNWWTYSLATQQTLNITQGINTLFWNTRDDHTASKPPAGLGGWIKNDAELLVYDEYNIWAITPDGKSSRKITSGEKEENIYRLNRLDFEDPFIDDSKPLYLSVYGDKTKKSGYAKLENGKVEPLLLENASLSRLSKARDADAFAFVKQDYNVSPELYTTDHFTDTKKVAATNPQQENFYWGKSELINYTNKKGKKMQGALFYPANYEPGKQYPMIVYIYELLSNTLHAYVNPSSRSVYNTTNFTSNGYFVFRPDIVYDTNEPGISAVNCVVPAVEEVLKTGMIDKSKVGLMGHSWGGYQTAFIITQTDIFKAAIAGAPLTDMISMSLSIFWNTGTPDQKIFETSQGRFDGPWYERMDQHIRNSSVFNAAKIKAPLLLEEGDKDGAVDWHQSIELYGTMRRMEKPIVLLVYADENHNVARKESQIDYQRRQKEWFDHYLLGKPAEKWITDGVTYMDKVKEREKQDPPKP